jgi:ElaB/YqjD/DUF883 family membrane-anchored ribosome-binding protein
MTSDTHHPLDSTRKLASQAMERAGSTMQGLRSGAQEYASRSKSAVLDGASAAQRHLSEYAHTGTRYVAEHPMKSALIAAAIGAAVAGIVIAMRHRRNSDYF